MQRLNTFESYATHPYLDRLFNKLTKSEIAMCRQFLTATAQLSKGEYEKQVNRLYMDKPKPKNWAAITELLLSANC